MNRSTVSKLYNGVFLYAPVADGPAGAPMLTNSAGQLYFGPSALGTAAYHNHTDYDQFGAASAAQAAAIAASIPRTTNVLTTDNNGFLNSLPKIISVSGSKTLALTDANTIQDCNSASAIVLTIPLNSSVAFQPSTSLTCEQTGAGSLSITAVSGVTINGVDSNTVTCQGQYNAIVIWQRTTNAWIALPVSGPSVFTGASTHVLCAGPNGTTNPTTNTDSSAANCATGTETVGAAAGGGVLFHAISSASNESLSVQAKGSGQITLGGTSTGIVGIGSGVQFSLWNGTDQVTNYSRGRFYIQSNVFRIGTDKGGTGTLMPTVVDYGNTGTQAINVPTANTTAIQLALGSLTTVVDGQVTIAGGINDTSTTGTGSVLKISPNWNPTSTSTAVHRGIYINPTVNYSNGTPGAGSYELIRGSVIETGLPTGTSYLLRLSAGAAGTTDKITGDNAGNMMIAGTITTATWNGAVITGAYLNVGSNISAGTNITLSGAGTSASPLVINASGGGGSPGGTNGQIQYNNSSSFGGFTVGGDGTLNTSTGSLAVTKTNGTSFATSATTDTTNASNISSGTLAAARGGAGTNNGILQANGSGTVGTVTLDASLTYSGTTLSRTAQTKTLATWVVTNPSGITTGVQTLQLQVPVASTVTGWVLTLDAGTATVDIYKQAYSASTTPNTSIVGAGTKPNVASGITNEATSISGWTTTSVSANDQFVINITAAATCKSLCLQLIGTN